MHADRVNELRGRLDEAVASRKADVEDLRDRLAEARDEAAQARAQIDTLRTEHRQELATVRAEHVEALQGLREHRAP